MSDMSVPQPVSCDPSPVTLPLDQPRIVCIQDGKFAYTFYFRRITADDWNGYFDGIYSSSQKDGNAQVVTVDVSSCGIELVERCLIKVEGYASTFDTSKQGWQQKIPLRHSEPVSWALRSVSRSTQPADCPFDPERQTVILDALWSKTRPGSQVDMVKGLIHTFQAPTVEDRRRYLRSRSASRTVGGARNGTTIYSSRHRILTDLYDKLICSVDGYTVGCNSLGSDRDLIRREMDAYHKVQSTIALFTPEDQDEQDNNDRSI